LPALKEQHSQSTRGQAFRGKNTIDSAENDYSLEKPNARRRRNAKGIKN